MLRVRLREAFLWTCPICKTDNTTVSPPTELTRDELEQAYRELCRLEEWQPVPEDLGDFEPVIIPSELNCLYCLNHIETEF